GPGAHRRAGGGGQPTVTEELAEVGFGEGEQLVFAVTAAGDPRRCCHQLHGQSLVSPWKVCAYSVKVRAEGGPVKQYLPYLVAGVTAAAVYALAAMGLVLLYSTSGIFNFAHGAIGMV